MLGRIFDNQKVDTINIFYWTLKKLFKKVKKKILVDDHYFDHTKTARIFLCFRRVCSSFVTDPISDEYDGYLKKRLVGNVIKTLMTSSISRCVKLCSRTDGCLAVNVIGNHGITCELTTGLSNKTEMQDDYSSELFVLGKINVFRF